MPDEAYATVRSKLAHEAFQIRDVIDEVIEGAGSCPVGIAVSAVVVGERPAFQQGREQVERAAVVEPAVQQETNGAVRRPPLAHAQRKAADGNAALAHLHAADLSERGRASQAP